MIYFYFDDGWRLSESDKELGGPFTTYKALLRWAIEKEFIG